MLELVNDIILQFFNRLVNYIPNLFGGIIIFLIGFVLASLLKRILLTLLSFFKLAQILQKMRLMNKNEVKVWEEVLAEVLRWTTVVLFLVPALEVLGLSRATTVLNQFLFYLPNVIIAVIIGFIGLIASNLVADLVRQSIGSVDISSARTLSLFSKWVIVIFTVLIVMNQLGVAQDLIRILFTGIVAMIALAGGLAFGLGGRDAAKTTIEQVMKKLNSTEQAKTPKT